jgi:hypothetical protein
VSEGDQVAAEEGGFLVKAIGGWRQTCAAGWWMRRWW